MPAGSWCQKQQECNILALFYRDTVTCRPTDDMDMYNLEVPRGHAKAWPGGHNKML